MIWALPRAHQEGGAFLMGPGKARHPLHRLWPQTNLPK